MTGRRGAVSLCLLMFALLIAGLERAQRGGGRTAGKGARFEMMERTHATWTCAAGPPRHLPAPVLLGFVIPIIMLGVMAYDSGQSILDPRYIGFFTNSVTVASIAALLTVFGAVLIVFRARNPGRAHIALAGGRVGHWLCRAGRRDCCGADGAGGGVRQCA